MVFIPIQGIPIIPAQVLSQCPSEAEHELPPSTYPKQKPKETRTYCHPCEAGHEQPMTAQHQSRGRDGIPKTPAGFDSSPVKRCGLIRLDRSTSAVSEDSGGRVTPIACARKLNPEAEEVVRIMEWTKGMVIRAHENAKKKEREMNDDARFLLKLRKWKMDSKIRKDVERGDSADSLSSERLEEDRKCSDMDWDGVTGHRVLAASMEGSTVLWWDRYDENRSGLGLALQRCTRLGVFENCCLGS